MMLQTYIFGAHKGCAAIVGALQPDLSDRGQPALGFVVI